MPTLAQKRRVNEINDYFRETWLGKITTINQAADDVRQRFRINDAGEWQRVRQRLIGIMNTEEPPAQGPAPASQNGSTETHVEPPTVHIPAELPQEAREAFNQIIAENQRLSESARATELELGMTRNQLAQSQKRNTLLKQIVEKLTDAM